MTAIRQLAADLPSTGSTRRISPGFSGRWTSFLRLLVVTTVAASAVAGSGVATAADPPVTTSPVAAPRVARANPLASARLYVDPDGDARKGADARRRTDPAGACVLDQVAQQAQAQWLGNWIPTRTVARSVDQLTSRAAVQGQVPVIVTYAIPNRDCGGYSANGFSGNEEYLSWARELVRGLAGRPAVLIVEPDALAQLDCLSPAAAPDRLNLLRAVTDVYAAAPGAVVYLDAGHAGWQRPDVMARRLQAAGVKRVQGFSLNVSNYAWTAAEVAYGDAVSAATGGAQRGRHLPQRRRSGHRLAGLVQPAWPGAGHRAHHGHRQQSRQRLPVDQDPRPL